MFRRKGQAALEFLMTYGWAILVVLAAIGALAYFGVLSPDRFLPEKCTLPSGIACLDFTYTDATDTFTLSVQNAMGVDMETVSLNLSDCGADTNGDPDMADGEQVLFTVTCAPAPSSGKFKSVITLTYTNEQTGLTHVKTGELIAKIP